MKLDFCKMWTIAFGIAFGLLLDRIGQRIASIGAEMYEIVKGMVGG